MAFFPKIGPFYDPHSELQLYGDTDGEVRLRKSQEFLEDHHSANRKTDGWAEIVQDHGNLFYSEPITRNDSSGNYPRNVTGNYHHARQASYQSVASFQSGSSYQSGSSESTCQNFKRESSTESERGLSSSQNSRYDEMPSRQSIQVTEGIDGQTNSDNFSRNNDIRLANPSYAFPQNLVANMDHSQTSQRIPVNISIPNGSNVTDNSANATNLTVSKSGKRKSVVMVPNFSNIDDVANSSGVILCEKLFGIKLCNYNKKPPRPNGANIEQMLRNRKIIVQEVVDHSQAKKCAQISRGDMLVGINDIDLTWVNIDELCRQASHLDKVKLTFQVPVVVGPRQSTPTVTPMHNTPPLPPRTSHTSPRPLQTPPPIPPHVPLHVHQAPSSQPTVSLKTIPQTPDLVCRTTGKSLPELVAALSQWLFAVMYLTLSGSKSEDSNSKDDVLYQFPFNDNKLVEIHGLFLTLSALLPDVTSDTPKLTSIVYRGNNTHIVYWKYDRDVLLMCLPEDRVPTFYLLRIFADMLHILKLLYGSIERVFRDERSHGQLDELVTLTLYRVLHTGVHIHNIAYSNSLEPVLLDTFIALRWLRLPSDDKITCDEILSEYEAQDYADLENEDPNERRHFGILGSCLFYRDYLICSHLSPQLLQDVHIYLKYHCILHLVSTQAVNDLVIWQEIYPTILCHTERPDTPGYREPTGRWFLLVVSNRHFLHCTILETGSYAKLPTEGQLLEQFFIIQSKLTLSQLDEEDSVIELHCNERLFSIKSGPGLCSVDEDLVPSRSSDVGSMKSMQSPRLTVEDFEHSSSQYLNGPAIKRQGSKLSYESNDSSGSNTSVNKFISLAKKGHSYDMDSLNNRSSMGRDGNRLHCDIKLTRGMRNLLFHYVNFDAIEGICVSPSPLDLDTIQGSGNQYVLYNFYACCLRLRASFEQTLLKTKLRASGPNNIMIEEAVMFTCHMPGPVDSKKLPAVVMYWVIGRHFDGHEMFVCLEDGASQNMLELAFAFNFGLT